MACDSFFIVVLIAVILVLIIVPFFTGNENGRTTVGNGSTQARITNGNGAINGNGIVNGMTNGTASSQSMQQPLQQMGSQSSMQQPLTVQQGGSPSYQPPSSGNVAYSSSQENTLFPSTGSSYALTQSSPPSEACSCPTPHPPAEACPCPAPPPHAHRKGEIPIKCFVRSRFV